MRIEEIKVAQNGFVLEDDRGNVHVAKSLAEAAQIAGETSPQSPSCTYAPGYHAGFFRKARTHALQGQKIEAIKVLRDMFSHRIGLKEAKEMVEVLILDQ